MRLVRFRTASGNDSVGVLAGDQIIDVTASVGRHENPILPLLALGARERLAIAESSRDRAFDHVDVRLLSPLVNPGKVLAIARGYRRGNEPELSPEGTPYLFMKRGDEILGPSDPIPLSSPATAVVAEIEIALVIAHQAKRVTPNSALSRVGGYTVANDVSARALELPPPGRRSEQLDGFMDWLNGKWLDGFLALGPAIVTPDEWSDDGNRSLTTRVSGTTTVTGSTSSLMHRFEEIVAFASRLMTLHPGDVILTGMPETPKPERHLTPGDVVEGEVSGRGVLVNPVVSEDNALAADTKATD